MEDNESDEEMCLVAAAAACWRDCCSGDRTESKKDVASGLDLCFDDARILCTATDARIKRIRERNAGFTKLTSDEFDTLLSMVGDDISRSRTFSLLLMAHSR